MGVALAAGRRLRVLLLALLSLGQFSLPASQILLGRWAQSWWLNRGSVIMLTGVNTAITAVSELGSRTLSAHASGKQDDRFFVHREGGVHVHRQSMINIVMTLIASLLGAPVYFFKRARDRFLFFGAFGTFNSMVAQGLTSAFVFGALIVSPARLFFDLVYNGTLKFVLFELTRPAVLSARRSVARVAALRGGQDFLTTLLRVSLLNFLGFKG